MKKGLLLFIVCCATQLALSQTFIPLHLTCEYKENNVVINTATPCLGWQIQSAGYHVRQTAFRILVADDSTLLHNNKGNYWDSEKLAASASVQVPYQGKPLQSMKRYYWKVMVWDNKGRSSKWSRVASWQTALDAKDWGNARWIALDTLPDSSVIAPHVHLNGKKSWGPRRNILPQFRKSFMIAKKIQSATVFISGLGHFELTVNGKKAGDEILAPGWTNYAKTAQYVTWDVTGMLQKGDNVLGVMLGNGFFYIPSQRYRKMTGAYGLPKLMAKLLVQYTDGSSTSIETDTTWKVSPSPIIFSSIFGGEDYDAGLYQNGWQLPGFNDNDWKTPVVTTGPSLQPQLQEPVKRMQVFPVVNKHQIKPHHWLFDLGQNFSGFPAIQVKGNAGDTVRLYAGELINKDSSINQKATGNPSYFTYILKGDGVETWHPQFTYTGFRYVEAVVISKDNHLPPPVILHLEGWHIRNAAASVGSFTCSNPLFNKIHRLIDWAIRSNMMSVFTDCPHREKLGWLEQTQLMGASVHYNYDVAALNRKVMNDISLAQYADGKIPEIAPEYVVFTPPFDESPEWGSAAIILPWYQFRWYADTVALKKYYPVMKQYLAYLEKKSDGYILSHGLGDWFDIGPKKSGFAQMTTMGITATATWYYDLGIMQQISLLLGETADAAYYQALATNVKNAFNQQFFHAATGQYDSASQTANAMALYMGLVAEKNRSAVTDALVKDITQRDFALTAGDIGYRYVLKALEAAGRNDVIFSMNARDDVPGYGYQISHGATALTESWQAYESVSNNHFMLGHLMEWLYHSLAGIQQEANSTAYRDIIIRPAVLQGIDSVKAKMSTPYGDVGVYWQKRKNTLQMMIDIPVNTTATIFLPEEYRGKIWLNGKQVVVQKDKNNNRYISIGSGNYNITVNR